MPKGIRFVDSFDGKLKIIHSHLNLNIERSLAHLPNWTSVTIERHRETKIAKTMLFDPYVVMFVYQEGAEEVDPTLLLVDLRDNSVQETKISDKSLSYIPRSTSDESPPYSLTKYGENQILRYGWSKNENTPLLSLLTIESYQRILLLT